MKFLFSIQNKLVSPANVSYLLSQLKALYKPSYGIIALFPGIENIHGLVSVTQPQWLP